MEKNHATLILASYVTYKELSSHGNYKSPYQILAEFIKNQMIISKNPQFTGISARQQLEFTTHLLLTD